MDDLYEREAEVCTFARKTGNVYVRCCVNRENGVDGFVCGQRGADPGRCISVCLVENN